MKLKVKIVATLFLLTVSLARLAHGSELDDGLKLLEEKNYTRALPILEKLAIAGEPKAQGSLARMYGNGWGTDKNDKEAYFWASKGLIQDDPTAMSVIAYMHLHGLAGFSKNTNEAIKWYSKAASYGDQRSLMALSNIYIERNDYITALEFLQKSFELGDYENAVPIADIYANEINSQDHYQRAVEWLKKGSSKNDSYSKEVLADVYLNGLWDQTTNVNEALKLYSSIAKNNQRAAFVLGSLYLKGRLNSQSEGKITPDTSKGISYLEMAATNGSAVARYNLSRAYLMGTYGVRQDHEKGYKYLKELLAENSYLGYSLQAQLYKYGIDRPRNKQKFILLMLKASQLEMQQTSEYAPEDGLWTAYSFASLNDYEYFPPRLSLSWIKFTYRDYLNQSSKQEIESEYKRELSLLSRADRQFVENIKHSDLIDETIKFLEKRQLEIGAIEPNDLIDEGWGQFEGTRGQVNEPLAQYLTEEGLRLALRLGDKKSVDVARNNLGAILDGAANKGVRNPRLGKIHLLDGQDSRFGPSNLLWGSYLGTMDLSQTQIKALNERYLEEHHTEHPTQKLPQLPDNIRNNPYKIAKFVSSHYTKGDKELATGIAYIYEDMDVPDPDFKSALQWHNEAGDLKRARRIEQILNGNYVKDIPNFTGTINSMFEVDLVQTRGAQLTELTSGITASKPLTIDKSKGKLKLYALVIGNSQYKDKPLKNSTNDSRSIGSKLKNYGFKVTELENLTRSKFKEALIAFAENAKNSDVTIFFYSGHGVQLGGLNYVLPTDVNLSSSEESVTFDGISLNDIKNRYLPGATKLIFLDACRNNPFRSNTRGNENSGLAPMNVGTGTLISFATRDGSVALDGTGGSHSPYTEALLKHLDDNEDVDFMLRSVSDDVKRSTKNKQEPWKYGALSGTKVIIPTLAK